MKLHYIKSGFRMNSPCGFNRFKHGADIDTVTTDLKKVTCKHCIIQLKKNEVKK